MKRFAVVLLSVLLVLLPGCTKPVTESGVQSTESGTAESTAEALSSTESGAENTAEKAEHITQTLSSGVMVDADVYVPEFMQKSALAEMRGQGQLIDYEELKSLFCSGKTITEEGEEPWEMVTPGGHGSCRKVCKYAGRRLLTAYLRKYILLYDRAGHTGYRRLDNI